ncbi:tetratricopeptide repeat protein [Swingsia samuiensis]|uniref:Tetratricopeptide repeat protein n=1 Tax=Swingsia samuiensis TaxID=1293412 RepID=A0A4Y6UI39_9PROT|nr:tetratricopeptide repeat protein [Swingsia samuiensis]QDH16714.1 tetratricopeptide repeat protein [Swingsia samuiensis]
MFLYLNRYVSVRSLLLTGIVSAGVLSGAVAHADDVLGQVVGKDLQQAQAALAAKNYTKAMSAVNAADAVKGKTDYEAYTTAQMRAAVAAQSGDVEAAIKAYDVLIASSRTPKEAKAQMLMAEASLAYNAKNYPVAIKAIEKYLNQHGSDARMQTMLIQSYYLQSDWKNTARVAQEVVDSTLKAHRIPVESQLQMLATAYTNLKDTNAKTHVYVLLAKYYSKPDYWSVLVHDLVANPNLSPSLVFYVERLRLATGVLKNPSDYQDMGERAVQMGLSQLGLNLLDQGYANKVLGSGSTAQADAKFRSFVAQHAATERAQLPQLVEAAGTSTNAAAPLTAGYNLVLNGKVDQGLALMRRGLAKNPRYPALAQLQYGMAQMDGGHKAEAIKTLNAISDQGATKDVAELWGLLLERSIH